MPCKDRAVLMNGRVARCAKRAGSFAIKKPKKGSVRRLLEQRRRQHHIELG